MDSLFVIWAFDAPSTETIKSHIMSALSVLPSSECPDLIVVPDQFVVYAGTYLELNRFGQVGSAHRETLHAKHGPRLDGLLPLPAEFIAMGENSLLGWYVLFDSWLRQAGSRLTNPRDYLPVPQSEPAAAQK